MCRSGFERSLRQKHRQTQSAGQPGTGGRPTIQPETKQNIQLVNNQGYINVHVEKYFFKQYLLYSFSLYLLHASRRSYNSLLQTLDIMLLFIYLRGLCAWTESRRAQRHLHPLPIPKVPSPLQVPPPLPVLAPCSPKSAERV